MRLSCLVAAAAAAAAGACTSTGSSSPVVQAPLDAAAHMAAAPKAGARPDLSGTWATDGGVTFIASAVDDKGNICVIRCGPDARTSAATGEPVTAPPPRTFPTYKPEFLGKVEQLRKEQVLYDPALKCGNPGLPRIGPPHKIMQRPDEFVFLYDDLNGAFWRIIPMNAARDPDVEQSRMGDSIGRWNGDTLVIETEAFNDESWLIDNGAFHTENMKVVERIWRTDSGLEYQATVYDPEVLAEPWEMRLRKMAPRSVELLQPPPCIEQSIDKMVGIASFHDNPR